MENKILINYPEQPGATQSLPYTEEIKWNKNADLFCLLVN